MYIMLNNRYLNDGIPEWEMNTVRERYKDQLIRKIESGIYKTEEVDKCLCGSTTFEPLSEKDRFGLPFGTVICRKCGLILTNPRLSDISLPEFYDNEYHPLNYGKEPDGTLVTFKSNQGELIYDYLKDHIKKQKKKLNVVDIGCGSGANLKLFQEKAQRDSIRIRGFGCEYSKPLVEHAVNSLGLNVVIGGVEKLKEIRKKFDIVIMSHVMEHFSDIQDQLNIIRKLMYNDSLLYIEVPGVFDLRNKTEYRCDFLRYTVGAHIYHFCLGTLTNVVSRNHFELIKGNELVKAIFKKNVKSNRFKEQNFYNKIVEFLVEVEKNREVYFILKSEVLRSKE